MKTKRTARSNHTNVRHESESESVDLSPPNLRRKQFKRIDEYESQGIAASAPFKAMMGLVQADLFRAAYRSEDAAKLALASHTDAHNISELEPTIKHHLNIVQRIVRNARLEIRVHSSRT